MRPIAALACASLLLTPSLAPACADAEEPVAEASRPFETRVVVRQGTWLDSELDSTWSALEPGTFLLRLKRPTGAWVAEYWYFRLAGEPGRVYTFDEMVEMERTGVIDEFTESGLVVYQVLLYAQDPAQAARLAVAMRPNGVPARVAEALTPEFHSAAWH